MKLSIIVALYNTEKYIEKCIRSIYKNNNLSQESFEVIVVNDGSTDNSAYIVEELQKEFSNIQLINKKNGGQSTARNIGITLSKGDYIFSLDSDDSINAEKLEEMLEICTRLKLDALSFDFQRISESGDLLPRGKVTYVENKGTLTGGEFLNKFTASGTMWQYFYRAEIIKNNKIKLIEGIYHEDEEFVIQFLSYSSRVKYVPIVFYNYLIRADSTINGRNTDHRLKLLNDIIIVIQSLNNRLRNIENDTLIYYGILKKKEQLLVSIFLRMRKDRVSRKEINKLIDLLKQQGDYPVKITQSNYRFKTFAVLINNSFFKRIFYNRKKEIK